MTFDERMAELEKQLGPERHAITKKIGTDMAKILKELADELGSTEAAIKYLCEYDPDLFIPFFTSLKDLYLKYPKA